MTTFVVTPMMQDAIDRLTTSFRYDPKSRWVGACELTAPLQDYASEVRAQRAWVWTFANISPITLLLEPWLERAIIGKRRLEILETAERVEEAYRYLTAEEADPRSGAGAYTRRRCLPARRARRSRFRQDPPPARRRMNLI